MPQLCTRRTLYDDCSTWRKSGKPRWRLLWRGRQRELLSSLEVGVAHDMSVGAEKGVRGAGRVTSKPFAAIQIDACARGLETHLRHLT
jgi:hypothetical protein